MSAWYTVADLADELRVSPRTVLRWVECGELEALRLPGGRLRISQTAWSTWQLDHTTGSPTRNLRPLDEGGAQCKAGQ